MAGGKTDKGGSGGWGDKEMRLRVLLLLNLEALFGLPCCGKLSLSSPVHGGDDAA
jgi:hypothetical protein